MLDWKSAALHCLLTVSFSCHDNPWQYDHTFHNYSIEFLNHLEFDLGLLTILEDLLELANASSDLPSTALCFHFCSSYNNP